MTRVLLAEDDVDLVDVSTYALRRFGFDVVAVTDGAAAVQRWQKDAPDLVLLDLNLPQKNGFDVCRAIREHGTTPVIIVSGAGDEDDIIKGFEVGADDYMRKPVSYRELAMRARAVLQRRGATTALESTNIARHGDVEVDLDNLEVRKSGSLVRLTRLEVRTLFFLVSNAGRVVSTDRLIELVWNFNGGDPFSLKTHISHIRGKLNCEKGRPGYISVVPQLGYRFETA